MEAMWPSRMDIKKKKRNFHFFLDIDRIWGIIYIAVHREWHVAVLCNGSTADSDSVRLGSNPGTAAKTAPALQASRGCFYEVWLSLVERYVRDVEVAGSNPVTSTRRKP